MDFAWSVAHLLALNAGAPTACTEKKCPLCAFNATDGRIPVKSISSLS